MSRVAVFALALSLLAPAPVHAWLTPAQGGIAYDVAVDGSGNVWVAADINFRYTVVNLSGVDGSVISQSSINPAGTLSGAGLSIALTASGVPLSAGWSNYGAGNGDEFVVGRNSGGTLSTYRKNGTGATSDKAASVTASGTSNAAAAGWLDDKSTFHVDVVNSSSQTVRSIGIQGGFAGGKNFAESIAALPSSDDLVAAGTVSINSTADTFYVARLNASGASLVMGANWPFTLPRSNPNGEHGAFEVVVDAEAGVNWVIAIGGRTGILYTTKLKAQNKDSYGANWPHEQAGAMGYAVAVDSSDNVVIAGTMNGLMLVRKLTKGGATIWTQNSLAGTNCVKPTCDIAVDAEGNVAFAGTKDGAWFVGKLAAATGDPIWFSTPVLAPSSAYAVATTGTDTVGAGSGGFTVAKLNQAGCI